MIEFEFRKDCIVGIYTNGGFKYEKEYPIGTIPETVKDGFYEEAFEAFIKHLNAQ